MNAVSPGPISTPSTVNSAFRKPISRRWPLQSRAKSRPGALEPDRNRPRRCFLASDESAFTVRAESQSTAAWALFSQKFYEGRARELGWCRVGIGGRDRAGSVQLRDLLRRQIPPDRAQVLPQLLLVARADDDVVTRSAAAAASSARSAEPSCPSPAPPHPAHPRRWKSVLIRHRRALFALSCLQSAVSGSGCRAGSCRSAGPSPAGSTPRRRRL